MSNGVYTKLYNMIYMKHFSNQKVVVEYLLQYDFFTCKKKGCRNQCSVTLIYVFSSRFGGTKLKVMLEYNKLLYVYCELLVHGILNLKNAKQSASMTLWMIIYSQSRRGSRVNKKNIFLLLYMYYVNHAVRLACFSKFILQYQ